MPSCRLGSFPVLSSSTPRASRLGLVTAMIVELIPLSPPVKEPIEVMASGDPIVNAMNVSPELPPNTGSPSVFGFNVLFVSSAVGESVVVGETSFGEATGVFHVIMIVPVTGVVCPVSASTEIGAVVVRVPATFPDNTVTEGLSVSKQPKSVPRIANFVTAGEAAPNGGAIWIPAIIDEQ